MRAAAGAVSLATLLTLTGCSDDSPAVDVLPTATLEPSPSPTLSPTESPSPAVTAAPSPTRTPVTPVGSESPAPLGQPTCDPDKVTITDADVVVKPTYRAEVYVLRTTGPTCQLEGYPTVTVNGARVTFGGEGLPPEQPGAYTLSKATSLSFSLATARSGSCEDRSTIVVRLPGTSKAKVVATELRVCNGRLGVTPVHRLGDDD